MIGCAPRSFCLVRASYSVSLANAEPIGLVPEPSQLTAKLAFPTNVILFATI